jgi:hypothetical protein
MVAYYYRNLLLKCYGFPLLTVIWFSVGCSAFVELDSAYDRGMTMAHLLKESRVMDH